MTVGAPPPAPLGREGRPPPIAARRVARRRAHCAAGRLTSWRDTPRRLPSATTPQRCSLPDGGQQPPRLWGRRGRRRGPLESAWEHNPRFDCFGDCGDTAFFFVEPPMMGQSGNFFDAKWLRKNFVWRLTGALYTDLNAARRRERMQMRRATMSTGARLRFTSSSGIAGGKPPCRALAGCLGLLLWVLPSPRKYDPSAVYSRSPKNPALQQLQKSSKSASTTPQRPIWNSFATVGVRDFWENGCS